MDERREALEAAVRRNVGVTTFPHGSVVGLGPDLLADVVDALGLVRYGLMCPRHGLSQGNDPCHICTHDGLPSEVAYLAVVGRDESRD